VTAQCPAGKKVTGGGVETSPQQGVSVTRSYPSDGASWLGAIYNSGLPNGYTVTLWSYAVCATAT
jgi:hypothetical protein